MTTDYKHSVTIAVPAPLIPDANQLALCLGESSADIETFKQATYTDGTTEYAVAHTVVKPVLLSPTQTGELPEAPPHAEGLLDREAAQRAFDSLGQPGGIRLAVDVDPHSQFAEWGLERIEAPEPISINSDPADRLTELNGVGSSLAQSIIDGRPWASLSDLSQIGGISAAMVDGWIAERVVSL